MSSRIVVSWRGIDARAVAMACETRPYRAHLSVVYVGYTRRAATIRTNHASSASRGDNALKAAAAAPRRDCGRRSECYAYIAPPLLTAFI